MHIYLPSSPAIDNNQKWDDGTRGDHHTPLSLNSAPDQPIERSRQHLFQGTIARYIFSEEREPRRVQFFFLWRQGVMPPTGEIENALAALREALESALTWDGAS